jgi:broad specificity phosphatase PhoE
MSKLYLIRHAQASFRSSHYDRLSELGIRQSEILGAYFGRIGIMLDAVYSGSMDRQRATALACLDRLYGEGDAPELRSAPEFDEYNAHRIIRSLAPVLTEEDPSMAQAYANLFADGQALKKVFKTAMLRWVAGRDEIPGAETWRDFKVRVRSGIHRVCAEQGRRARIAVFTSGGAICAAMQIALALSDEETISLALQIRNASVSVFLHDKEALRLQSFNSIAHLELMREHHLITYR